MSLFEGFWYRKHAWISRVEPTSAVDFDSPEGKEKRINAVRGFKKLSLYQLCFGFLVLASGATTFGLGIHNKTFIITHVAIFGSGLFSLAAGTVACLLGRTSLENGVPLNFIKKMNILWVSTSAATHLASVTFIFVVIDFIICFTKEETCQPKHDVRVGFLIADMVLAVAVFVGCYLSIYLYELHFDFFAKKAMSATTAMETNANSENVNRGLQQ